MKTAVIAGASGLVGGYLLRELLGSPVYGRVVAVGRRRLDVEHPKLTQAVAEFTELEPVAGALRGDEAYCCLGTTIKRAGSREAFRAVDHGAVLAFAWAVRRGGARRFLLVSALGADAGSHVFYNRVKGETEQAVSVLGFEAAFFSRPSLLLGPRGEFRLGERLASWAMRGVGPALVGPLRRYRAIEARQVARAMFLCAQVPDAHGVRIVESEELARLAPPASFAAPVEMAGH